MKRIYKGKTKLRILLNTKCNLSGYTTISICCRKPDGELKTFNGGIKDIETGLIFYDVQSSEDFDQSGWWTMWPEITFDDDRDCVGRAVKFFVYEVGT